MADIIKAFSQIGNFYLKDEQKIKNKAYTYEQIKVYFYDIQTKKIEPYLNVSYDELIICRFGIGANSGNLFPNQPFIKKDINQNIDKFIKGILTSKDNLLSCFDDEQIEKNEILQILSSINAEFFDALKDEIKNLDDYKEKDKKVATYFSLSYKQKLISSYFQDIYEKHLEDKNDVEIYGYDILTNKKGIGADANLAFCSVNDLPSGLKSIKPRLLPMNQKSAKCIRTGFVAVDAKFSYNFFGFKMALIPTILSEDENILNSVIKIMEESIKNIEEIEQAESFLHFELEQIAKKEAQIPILNTILFYNKNNSAVDLLLPSATKNCDYGLFGCDNWRKRLF